MGAPDDGQKSFWQTLPGMLTAAAGLITAITGLVVAAQQVWPSHHGPAAQSSIAATGRGTTTGAAATADSTPGLTSGPAARPIAVDFPEGRRVRVGDAQYDILDANATPGNPGELALALRVRMTNNGRYPGNLVGTTFHLRVGEEVNTPTNFVDDVVDAGTTKTEPLDFIVPKQTTQAALLVGDYPANAVSLPLVLRARH